MNNPVEPADPAEEIEALRAEVAKLQAAFGDDVWRMRRLAELGVAQSKINHDLRNLMTAALMIADRLQASPDAKVSRSGRTLVAAIEQATGLIATTLDFAAEAMPLLSPAHFPLNRLIAEIAEGLRVEHADVAVENATPDMLHLRADRAHFARAIGHLLRTAAKAQAKRILVHVEPQETTLDIVITDDGRPFRAGAAPASFRAFSGVFRYGSTGLGFVIARDVIEAHGGKITIRTDVGEARTCVVLTLPADAWR